MRKAKRMPTARFQEMQGSVWGGTWRPYGGVKTVHTLKQARDVEHAAWGRGHVPMLLLRPDTGIEGDSLERRFIKDMNDAWRKATSPRAVSKCPVE